MKLWSVVLVLAFIGAALVGCGGESAAPAESKGDAPPSSAGEPSVVEVDNEGPDAYTSDVLGIGYDGALPASMQLALGTLMLEDTEDAVTPVQAKGSLPLWQAIQAGSLQSQAETNAVLKQIESAMVDEQLAAIGAMQLTGQDLGSWMREQGMNLGPSPDAMATRQAGGGGPGAPGDMSEEERAEFRATMQASGGGRGGQGPGGGFADMSEEERESMRATAEASGMGFGGRPGGGLGGGFAGGQLSFLAEPLVELLTQRAAE